MRRALCAAALAFAPALAGAGAAPELRSYVLDGSLVGSYGGSLAHAGPRLLQSHLVAEGVDLGLSGWLYQSRYVRFRTTFTALRLDPLWPRRRPSYGLGYGGSLLLFSRSILPISLGAARSLAIAGSTAEPAAAGATTTLTAGATLASSTLPHAQLLAQRLTLEPPGGERSSSDAISGSVYGQTPLQRYAGVAAWSQQRIGGAPATGSTMASIADEIYPTQDTRASVHATVAQGRGFGGAEDAGFTGYQTSAAVLSRLTRQAVLRTGYSFSMLDGADRGETSNLLTAGSTIDLKPTPLLLGEGLSAGMVSDETPAGTRTLEAVSASQGVATYGRRGRYGYGVAGTLQGGYTSVSDGRDGALYGAGLNGNASADLPHAPLRAAAGWAWREDQSSAASSMRSFNATLSSNVARFAPILFSPLVVYSDYRREDPASPGGFSGNRTLAATVTGSAPVWRTSLAFAGGYGGAWPEPAGLATQFLFLHASSAARLAPGTFGNAAADLTHAVGGGTNASLLLSAVWSFRQSSLSVTYSYTRAFPDASGGHHAFALLFSRGFSASFLPEHAQ